MKAMWLAGVLVAASAAACVSGAPDLTPAQEQKVSTLGVYKPGEAPNQTFTSIAEISAADCSGAPAGGQWGGEYPQPSEWNSFVSIPCRVAGRGRKRSIRPVTDRNHEDDLL